jgi:hypothetical protein
MTYSEQIACMGGSCPKRQACARYDAPYPARDNPMERLCPPGKTSMFVAAPVKLLRVDLPVFSAHNLKEAA